MDVIVSPAMAVTPTAPVPPEARRWNWGAFFLTWIWGIGNNVMISFLCLVPFLNLVMPVILGVKGGEWAWQKKRWDSVEHFQRVQRIWACVGFVTFLLTLVIMVIAFVFMADFIQEMLKNSNIEILHTRTISTGSHL